MTPTLESALSGLPAKPRVHELSKRIGISNKELLAALADRGMTISSASASVPLAVAQEVIQALLVGPAPDDTDTTPHDTTPDDVSPDHAGVDSVTERVVIPGDTPGTSGDAINPLFLPPTEQEPVGSDGELAAPARTGSSRRRRGRGDRPPAQDGDADSGEATTVAGDAPTSGDAPTAAVSAADDHLGDDRTRLASTAEGADAEHADSSGPPADESDEESTARGRRRRRGRRGRGRVTESDDRPDGQVSEPAAAEVDGGAPAAVRITADRSDSADASETDDQSEEDSESESDAGQGTGSRRRRRRRRRSTGDESPREDDPDNTVVHVREPRLSQAGSSTVGAAGGVSHEVQGVRGSTRLEAKRQRRRDSRESSRRRPQILTEAEFLARRESVERVMAVRRRGDLAQVALLEDGILVEHFVSQTGSDSMIGSVFLGKVQNVLPSMEAAFVDIGRGRNAVIYAGEVNWDAAGLNGKARRIETALSSGDTILAQVSKDPIGHKGARLTTQISLPGRFVVYVPGGGATGISRKLPDTERRRLKSIMDRIVPEDAGVIIRTAAEGIAEGELARDVERLKSQWDEITRRAEAKTGSPTQLYAEPGTLIKVVRDLFNSDITRLVVDGDDAYGPVAEYVTSVAPELADRLVRYESAGQNGPDVFAAYRIDEQIEKALERKVHLPSGGSLVIDRTEAMTVVDVNTGKYTGSGGNLEETVTKNNLEAAEEMVRQLRLRDIGGIIVIDFIDMVLESNRELVLRRLTEALGRDRTRHQVAEVTSLGLVQMTRKRMGTGLVEAFSEPCPHCGGRGLVLHDLPVVASASAVENGSSERRSGKGRRGRVRDSDQVEEFVVPRVVEVPAGRRPDPRGPKPPVVTGAGRDSAVNRDGDATSHSPTETGDDVATGVDDTDEIHRIEAAASAGIQAAADADADDFEAQGPGDGRQSDDEDAGPVESEEYAVAPGAGDSRADGGAAKGGAADGGAAQGGAADGGAAEGAEPAGASAGTAFHDTHHDVAMSGSTPQTRRRGRRSAGRPAGAPRHAEPVDIIVRESVTVSPRSWSSAPGEPSTDDGSSGNGEHAVPGDAVSGEAAPAAAVPRRRRAATRPAGPASQASIVEPGVISVPAEQPAG